MAQIKVPGVSITTIDKSEIGTQVDDSLVIGIPVETPTGPMEITKVTSQQQFLSLYGEDVSDAVTADMPVTMLNTLKVLQYSTVYVSRAMQSKVLPARSDKPGSNGSTALYVDNSYNPYYKVWKFGFSQKPKTYHYVYVDLKYTILPTVLATEQGLVIQTQNGKSLMTEDSFYSTQNYRIVLADRMEAVTEAENIKGWNPSTKRYSESYTGKTLYRVTNEEISIDELFRQINSIILTEGKGYDLPTLPEVNFGDEYINVNSGPSYEILSIYPDSEGLNKLNGVLSNETQQDYGLLAMAEPLKNSDNPKDYIQELTPEEYCYVDGVSYYINGETNESYPGSLEPFDVYSGCKFRTSPIPTYDGSKLDNLGFLVYMLDKQIELGSTKPVFTDLNMSINFYLPGSVKEANTDCYYVTADKELVSGDDQLYITHTDASDGSDRGRRNVRIGSTSNISKLQNFVLRVPFGQKDNIIRRIYFYTGSIKLSDYFSSFNEDYDYKVRFSDIYTTQKFLYRIYEFFHEPNTVYKRMEDDRDLWEVSTQNKFLDKITEIDGIDSIEFNTKDHPESGVKNYSTGRTNLIITDEVKLEDAIEGAGDRPAIGGIEANNYRLYYVLSDLASCTTNIDDLVCSSIADFDDDITMYSYNISNSNTNALNTKYQNAYITLKKTTGYNTPKESVKYYTFYNGKWTYGQDPEYEYIRISAGKLTYKQFMVELIDSIKTKFNCTPLTNGFALYDYDTSVRIQVVDDHYSTSIPEVEEGKTRPTTYLHIITQLDRAGTKFAHKYAPIKYATEDKGGTCWKKTGSNPDTYEIITDASDAEGFEVLVKYEDYYYSMNQYEEVITKDSDLCANGEFTLTEQEDGVLQFEESKSSVTDYTQMIQNSSLIVCSKYVNSSNILKYKIVIDEDDPEIYHLTLIRKNAETDYDISFIPNKVDGYGRSVYYTYVNDVDNGSKDFHLTRVTEDIYQVPEDEVESPLFGSEVLVTTASTTDFKIAIDRYKEKLGLYYDILFDGGYANTVVANYLWNTGRELYALALLTCPDIKDPYQLRGYREQIGVNHWEAWMACPRVPDTTLGEFVTYLSPATQYLERIVLNKSAGMEFAPTFYFTNGSGSLAPKYRYDDEDTRTMLINSQINPFVWDRARQVSYFLLDLTMQKKDTSLSDANNVRMVNCMAHIADQIAEKYIGRYNDEDTRAQFVAELRIAINQRMIDHQMYHVTDYRLVCDETNNPVEQVELRNLVLDILVKFTPGIRYVKVYQTVYKLSQDLYAV